MTVDFSGQYQSRVIRRVHLTSSHPSGAYSGKILLGEINDGVLCALEAYSETAAELVNTRNQKRGPGTQNCHDWATAIVRSLEDAMLLPQVSQVTSNNFPVRVTKLWLVGSGRPCREMSAAWLSRSLNYLQLPIVLYPYCLTAASGLITLLGSWDNVVSSLGFMALSYLVYPKACCCTVNSALLMFYTYWHSTYYPLWLCIYRIPPISMFHLSDLAGSLYHIYGFKLQDSRASCKSAICGLDYFKV